MKKIVQVGVLLLLMIQLALFNNPMVVKAEPLNNSDNSTEDNSNENQSVSDYLKNPIEEEQPASENNGINDNSSVVNNEDTKPVGISVWDVVKAVTAFAFVIGLLLFLLKFISKKSRSYNQTQLLDNLGGIPLGNHKSIQIVKVGNRILIVGVGENIQLLKEITNPEDYNEIIEGFNAKMDQLASPSDIVTKVMNLTKGNLATKKANSDKDNGTGATFQNMFNKQLNEMKNSRKKMLDELDKKGSDN